MDMTKDQLSAARSLHRALQKCASVSLGVYAFDGSISVCPQPEGRDDPRWDGRGGDVLDVIFDIGESFNLPDLDCDGGAGR